MNMFNEFYQDYTDKFETPAIKENVKTPYHSSIVQECFHTLANQKGHKIDKYCRIYVEGRHIGPFEAKSMIRKVASTNNNGNIDWELVFGRKYFLIFVNFAALFSKELLYLSQRFVGRFCDKFEPDGVSIEHHLIIGRYDETAFGVHIDDPTDRVFHFNLGPAEKCLLLWPRNKYLDKYKEESDRPLSMVSPEGSVKYNIPKGSCFFLPANYYHVGQSLNGISCVIALAFSRQSELLQYKAALSEIHKQLMRDKFDSHKYFSSFSCKSDIESIARDLDDGSNRGLNFSALLKRANARRRSNNSFIEILPPEYTRIDVDRQYILNPNARPILFQEKNILSVFSGGNECHFVDSTLFNKIENIVNNDDFSFHLKELMELNKKGNMISTFLSWLIATNGAISVSF